MNCGNHAKYVAEKSDNDHIIGKLIQPTIQPEDAADQSYSSNQSCKVDSVVEMPTIFSKYSGKAHCLLKKGPCIVSQKTLKCV